MLNKSDFKLFISLCLWSLIPSVYLLIRMQIVVVNGVDINILGQMEWFDLIDEIIVTTLTVPLYHLLKPGEDSRQRNAVALCLSFGLYALFTIIITARVGSIASFMEAEYARRYLALQSVSMLIGYVGTFAMMLFTLNDDPRTVNSLLICRILLLIGCDYLLIGRYLDEGAAYSEILVNLLIAVISVVLLVKRHYLSFRKTDLSWLKDWLRIGFFAGLQIFLDNYIYAVMICKMVNAISESGNYWVANNFIWGWLLVPVHCLGELIKKNDLKRLGFKDSFGIGLLIVGLWLVTMPGWKWFIAKAMAVDADNILSIVYPSVLFYLAYVPSAMIDSWFISQGKTFYNTLTSFFVNIVYYGIVYILFKKGCFMMNMAFIIQMFGWGNVAHLAFASGLYLYEIRKERS